MADVCDVLYVILTEIPHEVLSRLRNGIITAEAIADPVRARETWGLLPEHQAMTAGLVNEPAPLPPGVITRNPSLHPPAQ